MTEKRALKLPWPHVCESVSAEIEAILGISIECKASVMEDEFWDVAFQDYRLPIAKLCQLLSAVSATPEDWERTIPDEGEDDVGYTGMALAEKLLSRQLSLTWEHHIITEDSLWLVGVAEVERQSNGLTRAIREKSVIRQVPIAQLMEIIKSRSPQGLFMAKSRLKWVAVDNSNFNAWTEEFTCKFQAVCWLRGEFEIESRANKVYTVVHTATDSDKCRFISPMAVGSYVSHNAAQEEMERQIVKERSRLDERYDQENRGTDLWEMCQGGNETACFSRIEILETKLQYETEA